MIEPLESRTMLAAHPTIYVAPWGNDSNTGTRADPLRTLVAAERDAGHRVVTIVYEPNKWR